MKCKWFNVCPLRDFENQNKISDRWKGKYCESEKNWKNCKRFQLEEEGISHSDKLLPNGEKLK